MAWHCSAREVLARVSSAELTELAAFSLLEPWGCQVEDRRSAMAPAATINANRVKGKPIGPADLVPDRDGSAKRRRVVLTGDDAVEALKGYALATGGSVVEAKRG
jgi:hypothetical protein